MPITRSASRLVALDHDLAGTAADYAAGFSYSPAGEIVMRSQANGGGFGVLSTFASLGDFLSAPYVRIGEPPNNIE